VRRPGWTTGPGWTACVQSRQPDAPDQYLCDLGALGPGEQRDLMYELVGPDEPVSDAQATVAATQRRPFVLETVDGFSRPVTVPVVWRG
jgi:hypothetical protein